MTFTWVKKSVLPTLRSLSAFPKNQIGPIYGINNIARYLAWRFNNYTSILVVMMYQSSFASNNPSHYAKYCVQFSTGNHDNF